MIEFEQLHLYSPVTSDEILEAVFDQALRAMVKKEPRPRVEARFYPYAGLSWSQRKTRRLLGHHDHVHQAIIISSTLDNAAIPRFVVEYVLYHEMLHIKHPARVVSGRTSYHGRPFREDERLFERFDEAAKWLEKIAVPVRGRTRRRRRQPCN